MPPLYLGDSMKLTITKENGTKLIKEFMDSDVEPAKANGWTWVLEDQRLISVFAPLGLALAQLSFRTTPK